MQIEANTFGSDYDTTLSAYTGSRGALNQIACNDDAGSLQSQVSFYANAGETYFFMIGAYSSGPGGNLVFSLDVPPPPLAIEVNIDPVGSVVPKTGAVTLTVMVTCSRPALVSLSGELQQKAGRVFIHGLMNDFFACDGETSRQVSITDANGRFVGGQAQASIFASAFAPISGEFVQTSVATAVRLRGSRP